MLEELTQLMHRLAFPEEATSALTEITKKLLADEASYAEFRAILAQYEESPKCPYSKMFATMKELSARLDISEYEGAMLLLLAMCKKLRERYAECGLSEELFYHTMADLRYKVVECYLLYGIHGTFVASWFWRFYEVDRFALGRLQFEVIKLGVDCEYEGTKLSADCNAINIHIPRTGTKLDHDEVLKSYYLAKEFYKDYFRYSPTVFTCHTWLLYPWNETVLSPKSNMYAFYKDFKIIASGDDNTHRDAWRLFDCLFAGDTSILPRNTSLRRAYAERIERGEPTGWGHGVFIL